LPHHRIDQRRRASFHRGDGGGDCEVRWIVETAGSDGINYAVHSLCTSASLPEKTQNKNIIVRPLGPDRAAMGRSFDDLKSITIAESPSAIFVGETNGP